MEWCQWVLALGHTDHWYSHFVIWTDVCNSILPRTEEKAAQLAESRMGSRVWCSEDATMESENLKGPTSYAKQNGTINLISFCCLRHGARY